METSTRCYMLTSRFGSPDWALKKRCGGANFELSGHGAEGWRMRHCYGKSSIEFRAMNGFACYPAMNLAPAGRLKVRVAGRPHGSPTVKPRNVGKNQKNPLFMRVSGWKCDVGQMEREVAIVYTRKQQMRIFDILLLAVCTFRSRIERAGPCCFGSIVR